MRAKLLYLDAHSFIDSDVFWLTKPFLKNCKINIKLKVNRHHFQKNKPYIKLLSTNFAKIIKYK